MITNLEVVRESVVKCNTTGLEHTIKLLKVSGKDATSEIATLACMKQGFIWKISLKKIMQYKYHAFVRGGWSPQYVGDIPEFALDNALKAIKIGLSPITVHSMNELPVERIKTDPIMVGWHGLTPSAIQLLQGERFLVFPDIKERAMTSIGFVIAVWDNDKELEI